MCFQNSDAAKKLRWDGKAVPIIYLDEAWCHDQKLTRNMYGEVMGQEVGIFKQLLLTIR